MLDICSWFKMLQILAHYKVLDYVLPVSVHSCCHHHRDFHNYTVDVLIKASLIQPKVIFYGKALFYLSLTESEEWEFK